MRQLADEEQSTLRKPIAVRTIADLSERVRLVAHCEECQHSSDLDVQKLLERFGPLSLARLRSRLRCSSCGAHAPTVMQVWDNCARG
jgi:hypothetical protein